MSWAPLRVPDVPVVGRSGRRDNLDRLYREIAAAIPRGRALAMDVTHAAGCPSTGRDVDAACTCTTVDLVFRLVNPRLS